MEKLLAGKATRIKRRLHSAIQETVLVKNETDLDIIVDQEENVDGSKPSLVVLIRQVLHRNDALERGV